MGAKDTVVRVTSHSESIWCPYCGDEFGIESKVEYEREAQAEITFPIGKDVGFEIGIEQGRAEGKREVVEWVENHFWVGVTTREEWQAQLKEWGIE